MKIALLGALAIAFFGQASLEARIWTDVRGIEFEAEAVSQTEDEVLLRLPDGKELDVPWDRLILEDREYLKKRAEDLKKAAELAAKKKAIEELDDGLNWDDPWPETIVFKEDPEITVVEENAETNRFIYTSTNYRFTCDVRLSKSVVSTFADMFESTHDYCRALPLAITGGGMRDGKYDILLFETRDSYIKAGGPPSSSGVFMSRGRFGVVMVPLTSLGVRKVGSGYMRDRDKSDGTLIHELTHQLTPGVYFGVGARGWFSEGLAEYTTATPYRNGRFKVKNNFDDIEEYATAYGKNGNRGRALGKDIKAPALRDYMLMSYDDFTGDRANFNYGFALIITTYFLHLDGDGDAARMKEFLKELRRIGRRGDTTKALDKLLDGRTWNELEDDISSAWGRKGIDITFRESTAAY
ncbi:hypothetical protein [Haloferula sp.]|uniref:hypothetical protein n=1 Tax=Haloferula sp. TaxID=2497595 RepID=UPI003C745EED